MMGLGRPMLMAALLAAGCAGSPAPVPGPDRTALLPAPVPHEAYGPASPAGTELTPATLRSYNGPPRGNGYLPGSTYKNLEDTPTTRAGGMELRVPFR